MIRGRIGALAAPATALPRRGQRLAYEADGRAAAPLRRPHRATSSLKVALKTILLAGVLVASGGAFLSPALSSSRGAPQDLGRAGAGRGGGRAGRCAARADTGGVDEREGRARAGAA